jgi:hypothetical protein
MGWGWHVARVEKKRKVFKILIRKPEGKRQLEKPRRKWEDGRKWVLGVG